MSNYKPYPKALDTPNRKSRKSSRGQVFEHNAKALKKFRSAARRQRKAESND